jgi:hypothetical protein
MVSRLGLVRIRDRVSSRGVWGARPPPILGFCKCCWNFGGEGKVDLARYQVDLAKALF